MTNYPASAKQIEWIEKLLNEKTVDEASRLQITSRLRAGISKRRASDALDLLFAAPKQARQATNREQAHGYIGTVGEKISVRGTVTFVKTVFAQQFNRSDSRLVLVRTQDGKVVKTFGSGQSLWAVERNDEVIISGKVKAHEPYQGDDQTVLSHARVEFIDQEVQQDVENRQQVRQFETAGFGHTEVSVRAPKQAPAVEEDPQAPFVAPAATPAAEDVLSWAGVTLR